MSTADRVRAVMTRHGLSQVQMGVYLGVPQTTINNWLVGCREPNRAVVRLLEVLGTIEVLAPDIHRGLMPVKARRVGSSASGEQVTE